MNEELEDWIDEIENGRTTTTQNSRNYKCPKCEGEFNKWDKQTNKFGSRKPACPFCGTTKGEYDGENTEENGERETYYSGKDRSDVPGDFSNEEIGKKILSRVFGVSQDAFEDDQTNLRDLLERSYESAEQNR